MVKPILNLAPPAAYFLKKGFFFCSELLVLFLLCRQKSEISTGARVVYWFGDFSLHLEGLELRQNDEPINLEPQVFSLLAYLIENRDRVVTKEELITAVWGGRIITDSALNTRINAARRAIGDDGKRQAVIKTFQRRGFRFVAVVSERATSNEQPFKISSVSGKPSIAVLPFDNLSNDSEQAYFADGITEDLITGLSKLSGLIVIGRNSSFFYKEKTIEPGKVRADLGVDFALQGSVRKAADRVRITVQLTDLGSGHLVWAENHDGTLDDVFDLQDEITGKIISALSVQLANDEQRRLRNKYTDSAEAHSWFMRGRIRYREPGPEANADARNLLNEALALDPNFAWAYALRSYIRFHAWFFKWNNVSDSLSTALADAERAVQLDPNLAASHSYLGWMLMWGGNHGEALAEHETALSLDPNFAEGYVWYASTLIYSGYPERSVEPMSRALQLDPHYPPIFLINYGNFLINYGNMYLQMGLYDEAERQLDIVRKMAPDFPITYIFLAATRTAAGDSAGAQQAGVEIRKRIPGATVSGLGQQFPYANPKHMARLVEGLREAGLPD